MNIDVLTLDIKQCAACAYIRAIIKALPPDLQAILEYREWSTQEMDGRYKFMQLGGKVLPSIAIQDELCFESLIPEQGRFLEALAQRAPSPELAARFSSLGQEPIDLEQVVKRLAASHQDQAEARPA